MTENTDFELRTNPVVVGASGGSGTRLIVRMLTATGIEFGEHVNESMDALAFVPLYETYTNPFLRGESIDLSRFRDDLTAAIRLHRGARTATIWGWKNPRSILMLPLLDEALPRMRFIHVVRHGLDMATSRNQNQLRAHGQTLLDARTNRLPKVEASALLWQVVNEKAADYGRTMGGRYFLVRFEDVCNDPALALAPILHALALPPASEGWPAVNRPPARWPDLDADLRERLGRRIGNTLLRFGYVR